MKKKTKNMLLYAMIAVALALVLLPSAAIAAELKIATVKNPAAKIGETEYATIEAAVAAAKDGDTIKVRRNVELAYDDTWKDGVGRCTVRIQTPNVTLDGGGYTITTDNDAAWKELKSDGKNNKLGFYTLIVTSASGVTVQNMTIDSKEYVGLTCARASGGANVTFSDINMIGEGCGSYYGYLGDNGYITFNRCKIDAGPYAIHVAQEGKFSNYYNINDCELYGWVVFGACENVISNNTYFGKKEVSSGMCARFSAGSEMSFNNCTFSKEYTSKDYEWRTGIGITVPKTATLNNCKVEDNLDIQDVVNYQAVKEEQAVFAFDPICDKDTYIAGTFQTKLDQTGMKAKCAEGSDPIKLREAYSPSGTKSGYGAIYLVGKGAKATDGFITAGDFAIDPGAYIADGYKVTDSGDNQCPFRVEQGSGQEDVVHESTNVEIGKDVSEDDYEAAVEAALNTEISGIKDAFNIEDSQVKSQVIQAAKNAKGSTVTDQKVAEATVLEYDITAEIVVNKCAEPQTETGALVYDITLYANVTTHKNGVVTGEAKVKIDNSWLNGDPINVVTGSADITPVQVAHILESGQIELFVPGTTPSYEDRTFYYDEKNNTVSLDVTQFSTLEILGTAKYVSFDKNDVDAQGTMNPIAKDKDNKITVPKCAFTYEGKCFVNWNTKADGTGTSYSPDDEMTGSNDNATLYAQWKQVVTVVGTTITSKKYDGTTTIALNAIKCGELKGYAVGDDVAIDQVTAEFDDKNAGEGKTVTVNYTLKGKDAAKYIIPEEKLSADITKRSVTITSASDSKTYDGTPLTNHNVTVTGEDFVEGEGAQYTVTGSQTDAGSSTNTFEYTLNSNTKAGNYNITKVEGTITVNKRKVILTSGSAIKEFDRTPLTNDTVYSTGEDGWLAGDGASFNVTGSVTYVSTVKNEFTYTLNSGTKAGNYDIELVFGDLTITNQKKQDVLMHLDETIASLLEIKDDYDDIIKNGVKILKDFEYEESETYAQNVRRIDKVANELWKKNSNARLEYCKDEASKLKNDVDQIIEEDNSTWLIKVTKFIGNATRKFFKFSLGNSLSIIQRNVQKFFNVIF